MASPASASSAHGDRGRFPVDLPTCLPVDALHARLASEYLAALLKGERHVASKLVLDAARHIPIVAMTASALSDDRARCLAAGMDDHLTKPMEPEVLRDLLARWLGPAA